jgi:hypothetical protein
MSPHFSRQKLFPNIPIIVLGETLMDIDISTFGILSKLNLFPWQTFPLESDHMASGSFT